MRLDTKNNGAGGYLGPVKKSWEKVQAYCSRSDNIILLVCLGYKLSNPQSV